MTVVHNSFSAEGAQQGSYTSGTSDSPLLGLTIGDQFDQTVNRYPDNLALISRHQNIRWTYQQLQSHVNQCAKGLIHLGFQKGQRVGIWAPNRAEWTITQFATSKLGIILVNINPAYQMSELEYALKQSGCSGLVLAPAFKTTNYTAIISTLLPELASCEAGKLQAAKLPELTTVIRLGTERVPGMFTWNDLMGMGHDISDAELSARQLEQAFDDPINIQLSIFLVRRIS